MQLDKKNASMNFNGLFKCDEFEENEQNTSLENESKNISLLSPKY